MIRSGCCRAAFMRVFAGRFQNKCCAGAAIGLARTLRVGRVNSDVRSPQQAAVPAVASSTLHTGRVHAQQGSSPSVTTSAHGLDRLFLVDIQTLLYATRETEQPAVQQQPQQPSLFHPPPVLAQQQQGSKTQHDALLVLRELIATHGATHLALVVDAPGDAVTWRHARWPNYKSVRASSIPPAALQQDLYAVLKVADALCFKIFVIPGVDSADVAATLATRAASAGRHTTIVSPDKCFYQLLGPNIELLRKVRAKPLQPCTAADMMEATGFSHPSHWCDYVALAGNMYTQIPGVKGIGKKTATALVAKWGDIDNLVANLDDATLRKAQRYMLASPQGQAAARLSKELATLQCHLQAPALGVDLEELRLRVPPDGGQLAVQVMRADRHEWLAASWQELLNKQVAVTS